MTAQSRDDICINTIRTLSIDQVQAANSGHPGTPLGAAAMMYVLWHRHLRHNPRDPLWANRDRFILSAGHAAALLYSLLYLTGYDIEMDDLKRFRQWGSKATGHPEWGVAPGVETTTGPLGQGFANAVGMALAEQWLAGRYNRPGLPIVDHVTYCMVSDGDMQEGVASEAASIAATLRLGKLIVLYDSNEITIEGNVSCTFTENVKGRFEAYGWQVIGPVDGLSAEAVDSALREARTDTMRPSLIICETVIGFGSPNKAGTASAHGEPLGVEEVALTKKQLGWPYEEPFTVPEEALKTMREAVTRGSADEDAWHSLFAAYRAAHPAEAAQFEREMRGALPDGWESALDGVPVPDKPTATRVTAGEALSALAARVPAIIGGSADLSPSTKTVLRGERDFCAQDRCGRNLHFGVREHSMAAMCNGLALHGGALPYASTFLVFYDYMRPAVRLAALMGLHVVFVFTHDSIGVGEDGPTHQPIEHILGLRSVPNLTVIRPADAAEAVEAWRTAAAHSSGPTALVLTRQSVPLLDRSGGAPAAELARGAYVILESSRSPDLILIGTGSEVHLGIEAAQRLEKSGVAVRVVSMPSWELFDAQPEEYRRRILPPEVTRRMSVEAATTLGWHRYIGSTGIAIGIDHFGASAPGKVLFQQFGFTVERLVEAATRLMEEDSR
jgi:transketolase